MLKTLTFIRHNAISLTALFVALGGTSYAAFSLPPGSVGKRQIQSKAVDASKLDPNSVAASIKAWATLTWNGAWRVQSSSTDIRVATTSSGEVVTWRHTRFARSCMVSVTPQWNVPGPGGSASVDGYVTTFFDGPLGRLQIDGLAPNGAHQVQDVALMVICPSPGSRK